MQITASHQSYNVFVRALDRMMESHLEAKLQARTKKKSKRRGRRLTGVSRQRRMANTRERNRVQTLNETIEKLRTLIPLFPGEKRPSKMETIHLAALYIAHMTEILESTPSELLTTTDGAVTSNSTSIQGLEAFTGCYPEGIVEKTLDFF